MPKVGNIKIQIRKDEPEVVLDLWYSTNDQFFIKRVPSELIKLTGFNTEGYSTEALLKKHLSEAIELYNQLKITERKVLLFKISASTLLTMNKVSDGHFTGIKKGVSKNIKDLRVSDGAGICIEYKIAKEIDNGKKEYFEIENGDQLSSYAMGFNLTSRSDWAIIDWTEEREQFFINLQNSMQEMVFKLSSFFGGDIENVVRSIDITTSSNTKLLNS